MSYCPDNLDQWHEEDRRRMIAEEAQLKCEICEDAVWDGWDFDGAYVHDDVECMKYFLEENGTLHEALTEYFKSQGARRL